LHGPAADGRWRSGGEHERTEALDEVAARVPDLEAPPSGPRRLVVGPPPWTVARSRRAGKLYSDPSMNFFGHAVVSQHVGPPRSAGPLAVAAEGGALVGTPGYALGAMLPDFASMCGGRLDRAEEATVAAGIALHHRTDAVFHTLPVVVALMRELGARLHEGGCGRGPARAVSHIGVELLLDGVLVSDPGCRQLYVEALAHSAASVVWRDAEDPARFTRLQGRLRTYGVPDDLQRPAAVTERLLRVLRGRPRLAPSASDAVVIGAAIADYQRRVTVAAEAVLRGVYAGLSADGAATTGASAPRS
jgi:acyl carrier protein phosphodiesterase